MKFKGAILFSLLLLSFLALANTAIATNGDNGTVKIEDSVNPKPEPANDPHVCQFDIKFYVGDEAQSGDWYIKSWPPTGDKTTVLTGTYSADADGFDREPDQGYYSLPNGHYKLFWKGDEDRNYKHKVFWVECVEETPAPTPTPTPTPEVTPTPTPNETPVPTPDPTPNSTPRANETLPATDMTSYSNDEASDNTLVNLMLAFVIFLLVYVGLREYEKRAR